MKKLKKGFTIVELVIVIAVIAILASVLIPVFSNVVNKANESTDISATRNMNLFLASEEINDDVDSILDVYEIFEDSGFKVKDYTPLYSGRSFYYVKDYNRIVYVNDASGKIIYPEEYKGQTQGSQDWLSLDMSIEEKAIEPKADVTDKKVYEVNSAEEYAYIVKQVNKSTDTTPIVIELQKDLDFKGANVVIEKLANGASFTFNGNNHTVKNITANAYTKTGVGEDSNRKYNNAAFIATVGGECTIEFKNLTLENANVKDIDSGNDALFVASMGSNGSIKFENVTVKNSTVIGHRSVGALVGMLYSSPTITNVSFDNVNVKTIGGRSGLLFGWMSMLGDKESDYIIDTSTFSKTNSSLSIYDSERIMSIENYTPNTDLGTNASKKITSYSIETDGTQEVRVYGFNENAIACRWNSSGVDYIVNPNQYCTFILFN